MTRVNALGRLSEKEKRTTPSSAMPRVAWPRGHSQRSPRLGSVPGLQEAEWRGTWAGQSRERWTAGCGSGRDLRVLRGRSVPGLVLSRPRLQVLSLSVPCSQALSRSLEQRRQSEEETLELLGRICQTRITGQDGVPTSPRFRNSPNRRKAQM